MDGGTTAIVTGNECTGSTLIAKTLAYALMDIKWDDWDGRGWCIREFSRVYHKSLPYGKDSKWPDLISEARAETDIGKRVVFILCTRDSNIVLKSKMNRFNKTYQDSYDELVFAKQLMVTYMKSRFDYFIWNYETFINFGHIYLQKLYDFLGVRCTFCPGLTDGNTKYLKERGR